MIPFPKQRRGIYITRIYLPVYVYTGTNYSKIQPADLAFECYDYPINLMIRSVVKFWRGCLVWWHLFPWHSLRKCFPALWLAGHSTSSQSTPCMHCRSFWLTNNFTTRINWESWDLDEEMTLSMRRTSRFVALCAAWTAVFTRMLIAQAALESLAYAASTWSFAASLPLPAFLSVAVDRSSSAMDVLSLTPSASSVMSLCRVLFPATRKCLLLSPFLVWPCSPKLAAASRLETSRKKVPTMSILKRWTVLKREKSRLWPARREYSKPWAAMQMLNHCTGRIVSC